MALALVRIGLPAVVAIVGIVLITFGNDTAVGAGIVLICVACLVVLANLLIRLGISSEEDRERERRRRS